jgi:hypothetical protein
MNGNTEVASGAGAMSLEGKYLGIDTCDVSSGNLMAGNEPGSRSSKRSSSLSTSLLMTVVSPSEDTVAISTGRETDAEGTSTCWTSSGSLVADVTASTAATG